MAPMDEFETHLAGPESKVAALARDNWITVRHSGQDVTVRIGQAPDGRYIVTGVILGLDGPREITARGLRAIPLADLLTAVAREAAKAQQGEPMPIGNVALALPGILAEPYERPKVRPGPKGWPPEHFERVAEAYRSALQRTPRSPIRTLAKELNASDPTIHRWLQRCRDMGLLGSSRPGKAGEYPQTTEEEST